MKPQISHIVRRDAELIASKLSRLELQLALRGFLKNLEHARWLMKMNASLYLNRYNHAVRDVKMAVIATEIQLNRYRWARPWPSNRLAA